MNYTDYSCDTCLDLKDCFESESQAVKDVSKRCGLICHSSAKLFKRRGITTPATAPCFENEIPTIGWMKWHKKEVEEAARKAREDAYTKFMDEIRTEEVDNLGYIDLDSIENIYGTLMAEQALLRQQAGDHK